MSKASETWTRVREKLKFYLLKTSDWLETDLATRIFVALIYFPLLLLSTYWPQAFGLFMGAAMFCSWYEYLSFRKKPADRAEKIQHFIRAFVFSLPALFVMMSWPLIWPIVLLLALGQWTWFQSIKAGVSLEEWWEGISFYLLGILYITMTYSLILHVHSFQFGGREAIWFLLLVVGATDTGAYFAGKKWGCTPFFQNLSPRKTREGFWGGLICGVLAALMFSLVLRHFNFDIPHWAIAVILGATVAVVSVMGDLFESQLKRSYGVKDSGHILPGHGGILDRFDGVIFAVVPLALFVILFNGFRS